MDGDTAFVGMHVVVALPWRLSASVAEAAVAVVVCQAKQ